MNDFWQRFDKSYRLFSQFCDSDDWHTILSATAGAVLQAKAGNAPLSLLDVGCGCGVGTETICETILARTGIRPQLTTIEPSPLAEARMRQHILDQADGGFLKNHYATLDQLPAEARFDAILFIHSTYYISNFATRLANLVDCHLFPAGKVVALVLPKDSSFFLNLPALANCAESVEDDFRAGELTEVQASQLQSRFRLPDRDPLSAGSWERLSQFFRPEGMSVNTFTERLTRECGKGKAMDFGDILIQGKKPD